jgi:hypothetical protein
VSVLCPRAVDQTENTAARPHPLFSHTAIGASFCSDGCKVLRELKRSSRRIGERPRHWRGRSTASATRSRAAWTCQRRLGDEWDAEHCLPGQRPAVGKDADAACFAERRFESTSDDETLKAALSVIAPASKGVRQSAARIAGPGHFTNAGRHNLRGDLRRAGAVAHRTPRRRVRRPGAFADCGGEVHTIGVTRSARVERLVA